MSDLQWRIKMDEIAENLKGILRENDDEGIGAAAHLYERIDRLFALFSSGEGYPAWKMNNYLRSAKEELIKDTAEEFDGAKSDLAGWHGTAADTFRDTYLNQLQDGVGLMVDRIDTLAMILEAHQELVRSMRHDAMELVQHTLDGIAAAETDGWKVGMQIVASVAAVASTVIGSVGTGGGAGVVIGAIAASMLSEAAGVEVDADAADSELGVIVEFVNSGEALIDRIDVERGRIEKGFRELAASITGEKLPEVRPDRPLIITAPDFRPESFGLPDQVQGSHPVPTNTADVVPEPPKHQDGPFDRTKSGKDRYPEQGSA
jgi:hypothetical protein